MPSLSISPWPYLGYKHIPSVRMMRFGVLPIYSCTVVFLVLQDKVLVSMGPHNEGIQVTNDGATILKSIGVDNPAAKVLVGM